jgi:hypothetical protein
MAAPPASSGAEAPAVAELSAAMLQAMMPVVSGLSAKLVELQQQQQVLVATVTIQREELEGGSAEWLQAKAVLDRIPGA